MIGYAAPGKAVTVGCAAMKSKLAAGAQAPDFELPSTTGEAVSLGSLRGEPFVLYFYPRDMTPGCTQEACDFRDAYRRLGVRVFGVSKDSLASHEKFRAKEKLPFPLLSDADNAVAKRYGAFGDKMFYGKKITGTIRSTFLVDAQGRIAAMWSPVKVKGHVEQVREAVQALGGGKKARG
jgi:thioredoxin-dependent peroxiredoxin